MYCIVLYCSKGTFEKIEYICRNVIGNDIIFGGIQVIGSGDFLQLSPVPNILYGDFGPLCIESQVFKKTFPHHINLTEVMWQDEADLICAVSELEKGELSTDNWINDKGNVPFIYMPETFMLTFAIMKLCQTCQGNL